MKELKYKYKDEVIILFNGEDEVQVTLTQLREMRESSPTDLVRYFQATCVYRDVMLDLIKENGDALIGINDSPVDKERRDGVELGYKLISAELIHCFGEDTAGLIMADVYNAINLEKNGRAE